MGYDVIVVGGGHAGCEAAAASARIGARTLLLTTSIETIGAMSCNPSIGGLGKGHLVREIDACDGLMGRAADAAAIHHRMLNQSKGPAVQGPRVQADRKLYGAAIRSLLGKADQLTIMEGEVADLLFAGEAVRGTELSCGQTIEASTVIITAGTFLNGRIYSGCHRSPGGRWQERPATRLADRLREMSLVSGRLKTGTPPRLDGRTIDWAALERQPSDDATWTMSHMTSGRSLPQVACAVTRTGELTHDIIRAHLSESAVYSKEIDGRGPRYCPSIEDKVVRFADRASHQIFLEPEGLDDPVVYPNGISTSLDPDTQAMLIRSIAGLEAAVIVRPGYAVEYDHTDPRRLDAGLAVRGAKGLYLAGQINGTTGYEEAAAQGLAAGAAAAAFALGRAPMHFNRTSSYIGVMLDDLTLQGVTEPYRMLTARAEYRLRLRADNAATRIGDAAAAAGLLTEPRRVWQTLHHDARASALATLSQTAAGAELVRVPGVAVSPAETRSLFDWLRMDGVDWSRLAMIDPALADVPDDIAAELSIDSAYAPYVARQDRDVARVRDDEALLLSATLDYATIPSLSAEMVERLGAAAPETIGAASRVRGVTPAAVAALLVAARRAA